jgi:hypothetical protein
MKATTPRATAPKPKTPGTMRPMATGPASIFLLGLLLCGVSCQGRPAITFESLLEEMVDRDRIARYPDPPYVTRQFSSYDRASVVPGDPSWFANWDRSMFVREEVNQGRQEYVMMDVEGPGAIVRWWMTFAGAGAGQGTLRVYFDHGEDPVIQGAALDILSGGQLVEGPLAMSVSAETEYERRGHNLYLPLPYGSHVKVTYESENIVDAGAKSGGESVYYNINYRTYGPEVRVETFALDLLQQSGATIDRVSRMLEERDRGAYLASLSLREESFSGTLAPGEVMERTLSGSGAVRGIALRLDAQDLPQALRSTVLEMVFDGTQTVWTPAGDFFGTGYQVRRVDTWYTEVDEDGLMRSWWIMPFREGAVFRLHNLGDQEVTVLEGRLAASDWKWDRRSMHFGSTWRQYTHLYTGEGKNNEGAGNPFDVNYTHLKGEGVLVGDALILFNTSYAWWGEGDEKIYIDGESFPSHFGTGTEDYYGYAWCRPEVFSEAFIAQPDGSGNFWPGYTVNLRYRSLDAVPFASEIRFDMEMWHWVSTWFNFAPATFFYLKPGGEILLAPDHAGVREKVALRREDIISPWIADAAIEGENLIEVRRDGGDMSFQWSDRFGWSGDQHVWWREVTPGDELHLGFMSEAEGVRRVTAGLTVAPDYGVVEISINDGPPVRFNAHDPEGVGVRSVDLGEYRIRSGLNGVTIRMVRPAPGMETGMAGLDVLVFR